MAKRKKSASVSESISIVTANRGEAVFHIIGISPLLCNCMSGKAVRDMLLPPKKKNAHERATSLKHDPREEFRRSFNRMPGDGDPTLIAFPGAAFKQAISNVCIDIEGGNKSQIGRLTYVIEDIVPIYGKPSLKMMYVKNAGMVRAPDVRTVCAVNDWAARITVRFMQPHITHKMIAELLALSGEIIGIGDGRPQKGKFAFGRFQVVSQNDPEYKRRLAYGRNAQTAAVDACETYGDEEAELLTWFDAELERRGREDEGKSSGNGKAEHRIRKGVEV